ncbi:MAG TPA: ABC-type transport auxiliary lipoprotein family protein [Pseudolabrys sp.]|nr:ABC-type transport auxiliary lipoprotein family protein [Pseudolabrys sp.]
METRARYVLIGVFTLAVIFGMFGFVYWVKSIGGLGQQATYELRFNQPVAGLLPGASVLFNGVKVGAVTEIRLDPAEPRRVTMMIAVDPATPVRADTTIDITFQGLTGAPAIALKGGASDAPRLTPQNGHPPVLVAGEDVGKNLTESARETLKNIDTLIADNSKPLHTAITGFSTFADMLGKNSDKIEGLIGGLEKLTGGGAPKQGPATYDLAAATSFPTFDKTLPGPLVVPDPSATIVFDTQKILIRGADGTYTNVEGGQWADNLPKLMQAKILQSFENAKQLREVSRPYDQLNAEYRLEIGIRSFQIVTDPSPTAVVEFTARIISDKGGVADARLFKASVPAKGTDAVDAVKALNDAFTKAASDLVAWTVQAIAT